VPDVMTGSWNHRHRMGQTADDARHGVFNPHHGTVALRLRGRLDLDALNRAWLEVQQRHDALSSAFSADGATWYRRAAQPAAVQVLTSQGDDDEDLARLAAACAAPFDLGHGPLARLVVIPRGPEDTYFALITEHLVSDAWSLNVLLRDLGICYRVAVGAPAPELPRLSTSFAAFVSRQNDYVASPAGKTALDRYARRVGAVGAIPAVRLHGFTPCTDVRYERITWFRRSLDADLCARLAAAGRPMRLTALNLMHAALHRALHERSGAEVVATTLSTANRELPALHDLVGWFASKAVMTTSPGEHPTTKAYLSHFREQLLATLDDGDMPWPALIDHLDPASVGRQATVPYVTFNARPATMVSMVGEVEFPGLDAGPLPITVGWHDAAVATFWDENADGVSVAVNYKTDWYDAASVTALWDATEACLRAWADDLAPHPERI
jgi:condensation domain-containing protein